MSEGFESQWRQSRTNRRGMGITSSMMMAGVIVIRMMIYKEGDEDDKINVLGVGLEEM